MSRWGAKADRLSAHTISGTILCLSVITVKVARR